MKEILIRLLPVLLVVGFCIGIYKYKTNTYVTAEFKNLRPFHARAPIFYNGYKIGKVVDVRPNDNYSRTIVTMRLHPRKLKLPINISVHLKKEKNRRNDKYDYIDIVYPEKPSPYFLKDGDKIAGKTTVEVETYLANQDPDSLDAIKTDFAESIKNLNITIQTIGVLFETLNSLAEDTKPELLKATTELKTSSENLTKILNNVGSLTGNIDKTLDEKRLNHTTENMEKVSQNLNKMTEEINSTIPEAQWTIAGTNQVLCNLIELTCGVNKTLKKPFGGLRMLFGSPISK